MHAQHWWIAFMCTHLYFLDTLKLTSLVAIVSCLLLRATQRGLFPWVSAMLRSTPISHSRSATLSNRWRMAISKWVSFCGVLQTSTITYWHLTRPSIINPIWVIGFEKRGNFGQKTEKFVKHLWFPWVSIHFEISNVHSLAPGCPFLLL